MSNNKDRFIEFFDEEQMSEFHDLRERLYWSYDYEINEIDHFDKFLIFVLSNNYASFEALYESLPKRDLLTILDNYQAGIILLQGINHLLEKSIKGRKVIDIADLTNEDHSYISIFAE